MDELRQQIADLEIQEGEIERQLGNAETDEEARKITNDLNLVRNRLSEKREELRIAQEKEQVRAEVIEAKVNDEAIPFAVAGIDFTGLPAEVITLIDTVVRADRRKFLNEHAIELEQTEQETYAAIQREEYAKRRAEELQKIIDHGTAENKALIYDNGNLRDHISNQNVDIEDLRGKLANAVTQIEEKDKEIDGLKTELEDLKRAQEYNNRQTEQVTVNDDEKASISAALDAVKKLYTNKEDWGSAIKVNKPDGTFELVKRKEFEEDWQSVDVPSFRPEDADSNAQGDQLLIAETAATVEPPALQFPTQDEPAVSEHVLDGKVATEGCGDVAQVSREEFEALKAIVHRHELYLSERSESEAA